MEALLGQGEDERALVMFLSEIADVPPANLNAFRSAPNWQARVDAALTVHRETKAPAGYDFDPARGEGMTAPTLLVVGGQSPRWFGDAIDAANDALPAAGSQS